MKLKLLRTRMLPDRTIGQLYIDDVFFCFTLEDQVRAGEKVYGETAIPEGRYKVTLEKSPKFGDNTITINCVAGFDGIRIHSGNSPADTKGCPLIGYKLTKDNLIAFGSTRPAVADLKEKIKNAEGEVVIDIVHM